MKRVTLILVLMAIGLMALPQQKTFRADYSLRFDTYWSTTDSIPFWMHSNQNGIFKATNNSYQLLQAGTIRGYEVDSTAKWQVAYGVNAVLGLGDSLYLQMNQFWFGTGNQWVRFEIGAKAPTVRFGGLSSANGNYIWSNNARPLPGITISTNDFIPVGFWKDWFSLKALYQENIMTDDQFIKLAHLHHKILAGRAKLDDWQITVGLEHLVYWGGESPEYGKLPGWEDYPRYIFGIAGSHNAPDFEQKNVSGNALGMYFIEAEKEYSNKTITFYWNHPFEDKSGMEFNNIVDGLWGIHIKKKKNSILSEIVYEFMNTTNQSGPKHGEPRGRGKDDYFNNWVYKSGHTNYGQTIGSPLYIPVFNDEGICIGFDSNRMVMHHLGVGGSVSEQVTWKSMLTWSNQLGTYFVPYTEPRSQFSFIAECNYSPKKSPLTIRAGIAGDQGEMLQNSFGFFAGISYHY